MELGVHVDSSALSIPVWHTRFKQLIVIIIFYFFYTPYWEIPKTFGKRGNRITIQKKWKKFPVSLTISIKKHTLRIDFALSCVGIYVLVLQTYVFSMVHPFNLCGIDGIALHTHYIFSMYLARQCCFITHFSKSISSKPVDKTYL